MFLKSLNLSRSSRVKRLAVASLLTLLTLAKAYAVVGVSTMPSDGTGNSSETSVFVTSSTDYAVSFKVGSTPRDITQIRMLFNDSLGGELRLLYLQFTLKMAEIIIYPILEFRHFVPLVRFHLP